MKHILFAALAALPLFAGSAFAASENYETGPVGVIVAGPALVATGSESYQMMGPISTGTVSNVPLNNTGSAAPQDYAGQAATPVDAVVVAHYWQDRRG